MKKARGSVDARRKAAAEMPLEERRTYHFAGRLPERFRAQVDAYCRAHGMTAQEFLEAAVVGLLAKP